MTTATVDLVRADVVDVVAQRIGARHAVRNAFAGKSSGNKSGAYYETKGHAVNAFDNALQDYDLHFDRDELVSMPGNEGSVTLAVCNGYNIRVGYARISWYRTESGRYEVVGYIS
jgi:hypothetical protein